MQFISKLNGVRLKKVKHHVRKKHKITTSENKNFIVNSYHNYSISKCPKNFMIVSKSDDEIESILTKNCQFMDVCGILKEKVIYHNMTSTFKKNILIIEIIILIYF